MRFGIRNLAALAALIVVQAASTKEFVWRIGPTVIGRLKVPTGFRVELHSYGEGILTTLRYPDGAYIVLQCGGMFRIPMFQNAERALKSSTELESKTIRLGRFADSELLWREDNYQPGEVSGERAGILALYPPNVAYDKVPPARRAEFDGALDSFEREVEKTGEGGR
jgi:hypothetical protein